MSEIKIIKSSCRMCHGVCQVNVHLDGDKVVKVTGDPDSITSKGFICPKGKASPELLYHPDRITSPMRRVGKKGENKWEKISWDEALLEMSEKMNGIREIYGAEYFSLIHGTSRPYSDLAARFANTFGTPNYSHIGHICYVPRVMANIFTMGTQQLPVGDFYGFSGKKPKCIIIWGSNVTDLGAVHGMPGFIVKKAIRQADKVIVIDPKRTRNADKANQWLQLRPGTDGALALSMINVIIEEGLYDRNFVNQYTEGFSALKKHVKNNTPSWAEKITGIKAFDITSAARTYATTKPASILWGNAIDMSFCSFQTARSLLILRGLTGNIDVQGGDIFCTPPENVLLKSQFMNREINGMLHLPFEKYLHVLDRKESKKGNKLQIYLLRAVDWIKKRNYGRLSKKSSKGLIAKQFKLISKLKSSKYPLSPMVHLPTLWQSINSAKPYRLKGMWILGSNQLINQTNSLEVEEALKKLEYLVVSEFFMTPTAQYADLILPSSMWLEQDDVVNSMKQWCVIARKKVVQVGETMDDREVMIKLSKKLSMEHGFPWNSYQDFLDGMLEKTGLSFDEFCEKGSITGKMVYEKHKENGFPTPSGKFEFYSKTLEDMGVSGLPVYREPPDSPISSPDNYKEYPLILSTGNKNLYYFHSEGRQIKSLRDKVPSPYVEIHPETASKLNIGNGSQVYIETPSGKIKMEAKLFDGILPNVVNAQYGWWFPEEKAPEYRWKRSSVNLLFGKTECDPDIGSESLRSALCKVYPAN
ncbi:MAG: molybdopterin-dependent oxidoreductase [Desulfobacterales bacterium]|nr:molybdopterin-dependent oxidoreductase [Desulfobacterales bacterium]